MMKTEARLQEALLALAASERRAHMLHAAGKALLLGVETLELADTPSELAKGIRQAFLHAVPAEHAWLLAHGNGRFADTRGSPSLPDGAAVRRARDTGAALFYDFQRAPDSRKAEGLAHARAAILVHLPVLDRERLLVLASSRPGVLTHAHVEQARELRRFALLVAERLARRERERSMALHAQLARLEHLLALVPIGMFLLNGDGRPMLANPEAHRLLDRDEGWQRVFDAVRSGMRETHIACAGRRLGMIANETEGGWAGVVQDLTRATRLEEQRRRTERLASLARMAGGIAHDFNNQLMAVLGALDLLRDAVGHDAQAQELLGLAEAAARKMARLSRGMLVFSGSLRTQIRPVDLGSLAHEVVDARRAHAPPGIAWSVETGEEVRVLADPALLREALDALLDNAMEALGEQGGRIRVRTGRLHLDDARLSAAAASAGNATAGAYAFLEVTDNGPGIDPGILSRLFEPFTSTHFFGRGLGLALVSGTARTHAGAVEVESTPGEGACVRLLIPANGEADSD